MTEIVPTIAFVFFVSAAVFTLTVGSLAYITLKQASLRKQRRRPVRMRTLPETPPRRFEERLSHYLERDETEIAAAPVPPKSTMPFWIAIDVLRRMPPKSVDLIRQALLRIRHLAKGIR
jgi:hypothetical protein